MHYTPHILFMCECENKILFINIKFIFYMLAIYLPGTLNFSNILFHKNVYRIHCERMLAYNIIPKIGRKAKHKIKTTFISQNVENCSVRTNSTGENRSINNVGLSWSALNKGCCGWYHGAVRLTTTNYLRCLALRYAFGLSVLNNL